MPTNGTLDAVLETVLDTRYVNITLVEGLFNASYFASPVNNHTTFNVSRLIEQGVLDASFEESNGSVNLSYIPSALFNVSEMQDLGHIASNFTTVDDIANTSFTKTYDGIYLPVGDWTLDMLGVDTSGRNLTATRNFTSHAAIQHEVLDSNATAFINTSNATFTFSVRAKQYDKVKFYLNLSLYNSSFQFDSSYAQIGNSTLKVSVGNDTYYTGASFFVLPNSTASDVPAELLYSDGLYNSVLTLYLEPYEGLSAGTYTGTYGWGLDDG